MWIKICGIRDVKTAGAVARLGADALGLNFYASSPRSVSPEAAAEIVASLPDPVEPVGLFVNHTVDEIAALCRATNLRTVQLHGDEPPTFLADLQMRDAGLKLIRAHRLGAEGVGPLAEYLDGCRRFGVRLTACLIDARVEGEYGGTGRTAPWDVLARDYRRDDWPPLVLAGGLRPENLAEAVRTVRPWGVDTAGGVESAPGEKDLDRVARFIEAARTENDSQVVKAP